MSLNGFLIKRYHYFPGEQPPWWIGFYRFDFARGRGVHAPMPFNLILRVCFITWVWMIEPFKKAGIWAEDASEIDRLHQEVSRLKHAITKLEYDNKELQKRPKASECTIGGM